MAKNLTWKKNERTGKQYHLPCNIKAAGKNIKLGDSNFGEENQDLNNKKIRL